MLSAELEYFASESMNRGLILEELRPDGATEVGRLQSGDVVVGREPDQGGVVLSSKATSRNHGIFTRIRNHWFYRDLGSTNGSWVNGVQAKENQWRLVRPGSVLQFADLLVRVSGSLDSQNRMQNVSGVAAIGGRSLIVFAGNEFVDEYLIPEYGKALMIGGSQADLGLEGDIFEKPSLVVERRGNKICAFSLVKEVEVLCNDQLIKDLVNLEDGDTIRVGNYLVILNDPTRSAAAAVPVKGDAVNLAGWGNSSEGAVGYLQNDPDSSFKRPTTRPHTNFGQANPGMTEIDETVALDPAEMEARLSGADRHPSSRYNVNPSSHSAFRSMEDNIIVMVGVVLFLILSGLVVWWVFF